MIVVANRVPVASGQEQAFEARFQRRLGRVEKSPGFVRMELLRPIQGEYYSVLTYWKDIESFEAWTHSDAFRQAHADRPPAEMFAGPNVLEIHEVAQCAEVTA